MTEAEYELQWIADGAHEHFVTWLVRKLNAARAEQREADASKLDQMAYDLDSLRKSMPDFFTSHSFVIDTYRNAAAAIRNQPGDGKTEGG